RRIGLEWFWRLVTQPNPTRIRRVFQATFGLMLALLRYKVFSSLPQRRAVVSVITNEQGQVLLGRRNPQFKFAKHFGVMRALESHWQFPQGGKGQNEDLESACRREAQAELGLKSMEFVKVLEAQTSYVWNNAIRPLWLNKGYRYRGQILNFVHFTTAETPKPDMDQFVELHWVDATDIISLIHPKKLHLAEIVLTYLQTKHEKKEDQPKI
ncbi:MAG TPA: NUDIX domain-containing protein, partial [Patescibacteria group bacterium]|nr:NUDIX domain-containing protein [Patescibacteria group bacterium]